MEFNMAIDLATIAWLIPTIIAVTEGINGTFKIQGSRNKTIVTVIVAIFGYLSIIFKDSQVFFYVAPFVVILFGAMGIYNFGSTLYENRKSAIERGE